MKNQSIILAALEAAASDLVSNDIVTQILREEKGLPHIPNPTIDKIKEAIKQIKPDYFDPES